jgi:hypothetical protein
MMRYLKNQNHQKSPKSAPREPIVPEEPEEPESPESPEVPVAAVPQTYVPQEKGRGPFPKTLGKMCRSPYMNSPIDLVNWKYKSKIILYIFKNSIVINKN